MSTKKNENVTVNNGVEVLKKLKTKNDFTTFLNVNSIEVKKSDSDLYKELVYASKAFKADPKKVTLRDFRDLSKKVIEVLGDKLVSSATPVAENSLKPKKTKVSKKTEPVAEKPVAEKPVAEKPVEKKSKTKKPVTESNKVMEYAVRFPDEIKVGDDTYQIALDIKNMDDLYKALSEGKEVVFAYFWSKRLLKQFRYGDGLLGQPKSFNDDLDLATCVYCSDEKKVAYNVSLYTEAFYAIYPEELEIDEETGLRYSDGIEFHIYTK